MSKWILALAVVAAGCGGQGDAVDSDTSADALTAQAWTLASYDPLTSYAAARRAAAALVTAPEAVQLHAERTPGSDNLHTQPQPSKPTYTWTWTFRGSNGSASVVVGRHRTPRATVLSGPSRGDGVPALDLSTVGYHPRDLYAELVAAYPDQAHHAFDALDLYGPAGGYPQGWQALVYEQGDDDRLFFVDGAAGGSREMSID